MGIEPTMGLVSPSLDLKSKAPTRCTTTPVYPMKPYYTMVSSFNYKPFIILKQVYFTFVPFMFL